MSQSPLVTSSTNYDAERITQHFDQFGDRGLSILALSASCCLSLGWNELLQQVRQDEVKWRELLRMELEASAEEGALDMGTHLIAVTRKNIITQMLEELSDEKIDCA